MRSERCACGDLLSGLCTDYRCPLDTGFFRALRSFSAGGVFTLVVFTTYSELWGKSCALGGVLLYDGVDGGPMYNLAVFARPHLFGEKGAVGVRCRVWHIRDKQEKEFSSQDLQQCSPILPSLLYIYQHRTVTRSRSEEARAPKTIAFPFAQLIRGLSNTASCHASRLQARP